LGWVVFDENIWADIVDELTNWLQVRISRRV
jgi:hypothetical protein